jgi:hypothetical protein
MIFRFKLNQYVEHVLDFSKIILVKIEYVNTIKTGVVEKVNPEEIKSIEIFTNSDNSLCRSIKLLDKLSICSFYAAYNNYANIIENEFFGVKNKSSLTTPCVCINQEPITLKTEDLSEAEKEAIVSAIKTADLKQKGAKLKKLPPVEESLEDIVDVKEL